jgi:hypothetical protein
MEILFLILRAGPVRASLVYEKAREEGVSRRTLERAKRVLRVKSGRQSTKYHWWWEWRLSEQDNEILAHLRDKYNALEKPDESVSPVIVTTL